MRVYIFGQNSFTFFDSLSLSCFDRNILVYLVIGTICIYFFSSESLPNNGGNSVSFNEMLLGLEFYIDKFY